MVQEMGQLQAGHFPAIPDRVPDTKVAPSCRARIRVAGGARMRQGHEQPACGVRPAGGEERLRSVRERVGLPVRGPIRSPGGMDRAVAHSGRGQDILLPAAGAPKHQQSAEPLRVQGSGACDAADVAGRPAERARFPTLVPDEKSEPQAAK